MKEKINLCFREEKLFSEIALMISKIRSKRNSTQLFIFYFLFMISLSLPFVIPLLVELNKENIPSILLPVVLTASFFTVIYVNIFYFSSRIILPQKREFADEYEMTLSKSRCFFVKIELEEYKKFLIDEVNKKIENLEKDISIKKLDIEKMKKSLFSLSREENEELSGSIVGKISIDEAEIFQLEIKKQDLQDILEQIKN